MSIATQSDFAAIETPWNDQDVERAVDEAISSGRTRVGRSSMTLGAYNGFPAEVRLTADRKIKVALELGLIPPAKKCSVCGNVQGRIDYHAEDYSRPLLVAPICMKCHMALHNRSRSPGYARNWQRIVIAHGDGSRWFEQLR
ncbi:MAG TPA: hypothetical protein VGF26_19765 [Ramlibacter sp.]